MQLTVREWESFRLKISKWAGPPTQVDDSPAETVWHVVMRSADNQFYCACKANVAKVDVINFKACETEYARAIFRVVYRLLIIVLLRRIHDSALCTVQNFQYCDTYNSQLTLALCPLDFQVPLIPPWPVNVYNGQSFCWPSSHGDYRLITILANRLSTAVG